MIGKTAFVATLFALITCYFYASAVHEVGELPEYKVTLVYKQRPYFGSKIQLKKVDGSVIAHKYVASDLVPNTIEIISVKGGVVFLSGDDDWFWPEELWSD